MPDIREWISQVKRETSPDYWPEVRRWEGSESSAVSGGRGYRRVVAFATGAAVGALALVLAVQAFQQPPELGPPPIAAKSNGIVAFLRADPQQAIREGEGPETALFLVGPQGGDVERIVSRVEDPATWSPDGTRIAYVRHGELYTIDIASRTTSLLVGCDAPCQVLGSAGWSSDGTQIAYSLQTARDIELWVRDVDGTASRMLRDDILFGAPTWSPDGRLLAVSGSVIQAESGPGPTPRPTPSGPREDDGIFVIDAETGALVRTIELSGLDPGFYVDWSPDGEWLVFDAIGEGGVGYGIPTAEAGAGIYLIRPDGTDRRPLTSSCEESACTAQHPEWSPDGQEIAFTGSLPELGSDGSLGDLFVIDVDTGDIRRITAGPGLDCCPAWQPLPEGATPTIIGEATCAEDEERRNARPTAELRAVSVYLSCQADAALLGTEGQPLYMFVRPVPEGFSEAAEQLDAALRAYLAGPTLGEAAKGYFSAAPQGLTSAMERVSVSGETATVDFSSAAEDNTGNLGTATASATFLNEIRAVAFQVPDVQRLELRIEGDCDRFWHLLEMSCQVLHRTESCPIVRFVVSRLPWLPAGSAVPRPEYVDDPLGTVAVWFEDADLRWSGRYVALKRSTRPLVGGDLSEFPTLRVRGQVAHLVWVGDPGVGELSIVWREGAAAAGCAWYSLTLGTAGMSEEQAEATIREIAGSLESA